MGVQVHSGHRGKYNNALTGVFIPLHPEKCLNSAKIVYKSGLEFRCMQYLDKNPAIVSWAYEPKPIKYLDKSVYPPKVSRYFIDFVSTIKVCVMTKTVWIEVKPYCETIKPANSKNVKAQLLWMKNNAKWSAAQQIAKSKGYEFHILTEKQLN